MPTATLRPKGQLTIPAQILRDWDIAPYEKIDITYHNGIVTLVPVKRKNSKTSTLKSFIGIGQGCWGESVEEIQASINEVKDSWER